MFSMSTSQEFHLKTSERAIQHTSATSASHHCNDSDKVNLVDTILTTCMSFMFLYLVEVYIGETFITFL